MSGTRTCECGHVHDTHEHYRSGVDCGECGAAVCPSFRAARDDSGTGHSKRTSISRDALDATGPTLVVTLDVDRTARHYLLDDDGVTGVTPRPPSRPRPGLRRAAARLRTALTSFRRPRPGRR
jgi:hypothetical protein